jgi:hypothetical protein
METEDFSALASVLWFVTIACGCWLWEYMLSEVPRIPSASKRCSLVLCFGLVRFVSLFFFALMLQKTPCRDFGFYFSVVFPTTAFWIAVFAFRFGLAKTARTVAQSDLKRFRLRTAVHALWPYSATAFMMHTAFGAAYSSPFGLLFSFGILGQLWYERRTIPLRKPRRPRNKWE